MVRLVRVLVRFVRVGKDYVDGEKVLGCGEGLFLGV